jgi:hypothetical protein
MGKINIGEHSYSSYKLKRKGKINLTVLEI